MGTISLNLSSHTATMFLFSLEDKNASEGLACAESLVQTVLGLEPSAVCVSCCAFRYHSWSSFRRDGVYLGTKQGSLPGVVEEAETYKRNELRKM